MNFNVNGNATPQKSAPRPLNANDNNARMSPQPQNFVGFGNFPNQIFRRSIKEGFEFTLMVVGESGLGKSTFINTLFLTEVYGTPPSERVHIPSTVNIDSRTVLLTENDVHLKLTFVDTPGFGDAVDNSKCWNPIVEFIDGKFAEYLGEETKILRKGRIPDHRVHLCLYFISPTGHGLKQLDIECMKNLHDRVNIIPVIAKADTMTTDELMQFKKRINEDISNHDIKVYQFPESDGANGEVAKRLEMRSRFPFAVVGSNVIKKSETSGRNVRVREYPWGVVEVENMTHNDFIALRDLIIRSNLVDLIDVTKNVHYENFRFRHMCSLPKGTSDRDPFTQLEQEQRVWEDEFNKRRDEKERVFAEKVASRDRKIDEKAAQLADIEQETKRILEEKRAQLETLMGEVTELRRMTTGRDSLSSSKSSSGSPQEKPKKKGLFAR